MFVSFRAQPHRTGTQAQARVVARVEHRSARC